MQLPQFIPTAESTTSSVASIFIEEIYVENLTKVFPQQKAMVARIAKFLSEASNERLFNTQELYDIFQPPELFVLSEVLAYLTGTDVLKRIVRLNVENVDTADFTSVTEIPAEVFNPVTKKMVTVLKDHIIVFYQIIKKSVDKLK